MNKTKAILAFLILCTSLSTFGQFHTISKQPKRYHIEQTDNAPPTSSALPSENSVPPTRKEQNDADSDSHYQQYINDYLSVSFPLKSLVINSAFGVRKDPFTGKKKNHNGLDLDASCYEVYAMLDGIVQKTGVDKRSGRYITILHGEFLVSYCHLSRIWVQPGTLVKPGEIVGITGSTGRSTGEHLSKLRINVHPLIVLCCL